jgi:hypothetical protein
MKKVKVKLKDITILNDTIHAAEWRVKDKHQCWLGKNELEKIVNYHEKGKVYKKKLFNKIT